MCHYCHVLRNNPTAPIHSGARCLDRSNTYSKVPMAQRIYNLGQPFFPLPSAPPAAAPDHRSISCRDRANTYSKFPMEKRTYDHGKPFVDLQVITVNTTTNSTKN